MILDVTREILMRSITFGHSARSRELYYHQSRQRPEQSPNRAWLPYCWSILAPPVSLGLGWGVVTGVVNIEVSNQKSTIQT